MELRLNKPKEAFATIDPFVQDFLAKSRYRMLGLYYHGFAAFLNQDYLVAGRSLNQLAPFTDPVNGLHARYLMGESIKSPRNPTKQPPCTMASWPISTSKRKKRSRQSNVQKPSRTTQRPRRVLEALAKGPLPDCVAGSTFYSATLLYEAGKFGETLGRFQAFVKDFANSPLAPKRPFEWLLPSSVEAVSRSNQHADAPR